MYNMQLYSTGKQAHLTNDEAMRYLFNWYLNDPNIESSSKVLCNLFHRVGPVQRIENSLLLIGAS